MEKNMTNYDWNFKRNYSREMDPFTKSLLGGSAVAVTVAVGGNILNINIPTITYIASFVAGQYATLLPMFHEMYKLDKGSRHLLAIANEYSYAKTLSHKNK